MSRVGPLLAVLALAALPLAAQQPAARAFDVTSVRQNVSGSRNTGLNIKGEAFTVTNFTLLGLIQTAYEVTAAQIVGGPDWVRTDRFDVAAKTAAGSNRDQMALMLRALLEDRFQLRVRNEQREMAIFELALANADGRVGANLHDCSKDAGGSTPEQPFRAPPGGAVAAGACGPISNIARLVGARVQGIVQDKTSLTGQWRYNISYGPDLPDPNSANPDLPPFVTALREQLGFRLDRTRGPVDVLVIDSVQRPLPD